MKKESNKNSSGKKDESKITLKERLLFKLAKREMKKKHRKLKKILEKDEKQVMKEKEKMVKYIWSMNEMFEMYEDDDVTPITEETLKLKSPEKLMDIFEKMVEVTEKEINISQQGEING